MADPFFKVMARDCGQCLMTPNRIVSGERAAQIIRDTRRQDVKFICHKAGNGSQVACFNHNRLYPCAAQRFAAAVGIPTVRIDPDTLEPVT